MNDSLIQKAIARSNLNRILWSTLGIIAVFAVAVLNFRYLYNFAFGPFNAETEVLKALTSDTDTQKYWVNVSGDEMINTGFQYYTTHDDGSETVDTTYFAMILEDRLLLVFVDGDIVGDYLPGEQTGWLEPLTEEEKGQVILPLEQDEPDIQGLFLPYKLHTGNFRINGYIGLTIAALVLLVCLWYLLTGLLRFANPDSHPIMKKLERLGPIETVTSRIDTELAMPHTQIGKLHLTSNWLVYATSSNLMAVPLQDIIWMYKHVYTQRTYGIVTSRICTAMVQDRYGETLKCVAGRKEEAADEMLAGIYTRAPWALIGYSNDLQKAWKKDRPGMIAEVDRRKSGQSNGS